MLDSIKSLFVTRHFPSDPLYNVIETEDGWFTMRELPTKMELGSVADSTDQKSRYFTFGNDPNQTYMMTKIDTYLLLSGYGSTPVPDKHRLKMLFKDGNNGDRGYGGNYEILSSGGCKTEYIFDTHSDQFEQSILASDRGENISGA